MIKKIFGMVRHMKSQETPQPRYWSIPPKHNDNDSDWNENLYPQNYRAKSQSQVSPR